MSIKRYSLFFIVYSVILILYLILDFTYSKFFLINPIKKISIKHKIFHHHLLSNFEEISGGDGYPKYKVITNSLGFRDSIVRDIDLKKKK